MKSDVRTKANFARSPVDLTLEQTINADASNQLTDKPCCLLNISTSKMSAQSQYEDENIKESIGLTKKDDTLHSLQKRKIKKDKKNLDRITEAITDTMNPFDDTMDKDILFNISTDKAVSQEVADFNFCKFDKPIKRNKTCNFASQCTAKVLTTKDKKKGY